MTKIVTTFILYLMLLPSVSYAEFPETSIGIIDINRILSESKAAIDASKQIEKIARDIEDEIKDCLLYTSPSPRDS